MPADVTIIDTPPSPPLCDAQGPIPEFPPRSFDDSGRLVPLSAEQRAARRAAALRTLDVLGEVTDETDTEEAWRGFYRGLDAGRPHRPLFEGMY